MSELPDFKAGSLKRDFIHQCAILWTHRMDTLAIAQRLNVTEAEVYNRLSLIKCCAKDLRA